MNKSWNSLQEFETKDLIERYFLKKHNRKASASKVREIASNFIQGREYFINAERSNLTVRPLLLYYGVLALSRGLILACDPFLSESALKPSHGLEIKNWQEALKAKDFGALKISICQGAFLDLLKATGNKSYFRHNTNAINWKVDFPMPLEGSSLTFRELSLCFPDLSQEFHTWTDTKAHMFTLQSFKVNASEEAVIEIPDYITPEVVIENLVAKAFRQSCRIDSEGKKNFLIVTQEFFPNFAQSWEGHWDIGDVVLVPPTKNKTYLSSLGTFFAASYTLGMLARYFPSTWIWLGRIEKGDSIYPFIIRLLGLIQNSYPVAVLDYLKGPYDFEKVD